VDEANHLGLLLEAEGGEEEDPLQPRAMEAAAEEAAVAWQSIRV
jgi:hypothetical protein